MIYWVDNYIRQPVSLLFPPHSEIRKRGNNKETIYLPACFIQLASDTKISHATTITTLWLKQLICFYSECFHEQQDH